MVTTLITRNSGNHLIWIILATGTVCRAQPCKPIVPVIATRQALTASVAARPEARFVRLEEVIPGLITDLRYATPNNFTHSVLYTQGAAYMRQEPAAALSRVQQELQKKHLALKIFDAYRPYSITCSLWHHTDDKRYVANPRRGSHHNRGTAADLTLVDLRTGRELDMGTGFDNFTDTAHHDFAGLPPQVIANRRLLKHIMWKHGFNFVPTEWWHYHWRDKSYDVVDLGFDELR